MKPVAAHGQGPSSRPHSPRPTGPRPPPRPRTRFKLLTARSREACYDLVAAHSLAYAVGSASSDEVDALGIVPATPGDAARGGRLAIAPITC